jgi:hypothetical protein
MTIEEILLQVAVAELPDLLKLGRAVYDAIEKSIGPNATQAAQSVADVEVMAAEVAADTAEAAKFPKSDG